MPKLPEKRSVDLQIISDWVEPGSRVLDLGCGRGVLLDYLTQTRSVFAVGVDLDHVKVLACIRKGVPVYQGDLMDTMKGFPDQHFDRVICSRTLQDLVRPREVILEALRLARYVTIGFTNDGFWSNRLSYFLHGRRVHNEVHPLTWPDSRPSNPVSIGDFENFCRIENIIIERKVYLAGDWKSANRFLPTLFCGYGIYDLTR